MFKKLYFKQVIPDIIFAAGIVLLVIGIFYLIQSDTSYKNEQVITNLENQADLQLNKEIQLSVNENDNETNNNFTQETGKQDQKKVNFKENKPDQISVVPLENINNFPLDIKLENKAKDLMMLTRYKSETIDNYLTQEKSFTELNNKSTKEKVVVIIPEGSSGQEVAHIFDESNLITYNEFIRLLVMFDMETRIKAGKYTFNSDSTVSNILSKILIK